MLIWKPFITFINSYKDKLAKQVYKHLSINLSTAHYIFFTKII